MQNHEYINGSPASITTTNHLYMSAVQFLEASAGVGAGFAYCLAFRLGGPFLAQEMSILTGASSGGNLDLGIYTDTGLRLASTGSIPHNTINSFVRAPLTSEVRLERGSYFMVYATDAAAAASGTLMTRNAWHASFRMSGGIVVGSVAFPLPESITLTPSANNYRWCWPAIHGRAL